MLRLILSATVLLIGSPGWASTCQEQNRAYQQEIDLQARIQAEIARLQRDIKQEKFNQDSKWFPTIEKCKARQAAFQKVDVRLGQARQFLIQLQTIISERLTTDSALGEMSQLLAQSLVTGQEGSISRQLRLLVNQYGPALSNEIAVELTRVADLIRLLEESSREWDKQKQEIVGQLIITNRPALEILLSETFLFVEESNADSLEIQQQIASLRSDETQASGEVERSNQRITAYNEEIARQNNRLTESRARQAQIGGKRACIRVRMPHETSIGS